MSTYIHTAHKLTDKEQERVINLIKAGDCDEADRLMKKLRRNRVIGLRSCGWQFLFNENDDLYGHTFAYFKNYLMQDDVELLLWDYDPTIGDYRKTTKEEFLDYVVKASERKTQFEYGGYRTVDGFNFTSHDMNIDDPE